MGKDLERRLFDVDEYHRLAAEGILTADERVELIDGEIFRMSPIGPRHARCVAALTRLFLRRLDDRAVVWPQNPLRLHFQSEPEPDLTLLHPPLESYALRTPGPRDVFLVVEVTDTSHYRDQTIKLPRYATAGIPEVWIVDLDAGVIDAYREPMPELYRRSRRAERGGTIAPIAFPDVRLPVSEILG